MRIMIRSFENLEKHHFLGLTRDTRKIGLPESRVLYTVLRSPHIDKKSREQFEMEIKTKFLVIKTETHELRKKLFRLKYLELNMKFVFLARPVRIKKNSRDCFDYRLLAPSNSKLNLLPQFEAAKQRKKKSFSDDDAQCPPFSIRLIKKI
nr:ribosomal protein S10 [Gastrodia angusta]